MSYETNDKMVSHPDHYKSGKYEVIDIIDEFTKDLSGTEAVCTANAIKYILRWKKKNGIQDVKKAIWYLQHLVDKEEELDRMNCKTCKHENEICSMACTYLNPVDWEPKEVDEKIELNTCKECRYFPTTYCSFTGDIVTEEKSMCACFEEKKKEVDMDKIMNPPTNEEIHSCDDCVSKYDNPGTTPCKDCDLSSNPPSNWVARD